jgi:hypothetical protein
VESNNGGLESPKPVAVNQQQAVEITQLKETNRILRCQVSDLQADNVQLRLRLTAAQAQAVVDSANAGTAAGGGSALEKQINHIEENRKKEKEATALLLQHDEQVIQQLSEELKELRKKHAQDAEIIGDCAERSITLTETLAERETVISELTGRNDSLAKQVDSLRDQLRRQDILLVKKYTDEERLAYGIQGTTFNTSSSLAPPFAAQQHASPWTHSVQIQTSTGGGGGGGLSSAMQSPVQTVNPLSPVSTMKQNHLESLLFGGGGSSGSVDGADTGFNTDPNPNDNSITLIGSPESRPRSSMGSPLAMTTGTATGGGSLSRNSFVGFSAQTAWEELHSLRREKAVLIKSLQESQVKLIDTVDAHEKESKTRNYAVYVCLSAVRM